MAEPTPITQEPLTAPVPPAPVPNVQTPAPPQNIAPASPPVAPLEPHPITPETVAHLTVDMNSLTAAVDKAYGRE